MKSQENRFYAFEKFTFLAFLQKFLQPKKNQGETKIDCFLKLNIVNFIFERQMKKINRCTQNR